MLHDSAESMVIIGGTAFCLQIPTLFIHNVIRLDEKAGLGFEV